MKKSIVRLCGYLGFTALLLTSCQKGNLNLSKSKASTLARSPISDFKVIGYLPSWAGDIAAVQFNKLTHINYSFLIPTADGGYSPIDNSGKLSAMVSAAHNANVKAVISVGGGGGGNSFSSIVTNSSTRTSFVNNMLGFVSQYQLDGVDIDWEYPNVGAEANNFLSLMQELSSALHNQGKILSMAVIGEGGDYVVDGIFPLVDYIEIMAYDDNNFQHATYQLGNDCLAYWLGRGVPAAKAILGVPFYGHNSALNPNDPNAQVDYNLILQNGGNPNLDVSGAIGYNGIRTIKSKTSYAINKGGGVTMWDLSGDVTDNNSLLSAIHQVITDGGSLGTGAPAGQLISLKGNNSNYVSSENGLQAMTCTRPAAQAWEQFSVIDAGFGRVALQSQGHFVSSENGLQSITCSRTGYASWETFDWYDIGNGNVSLRSANGLFISSENGQNTMTCVKPVAQAWEVFGVNK